MDKRAAFRQWLSSGHAALHPLTLPQRELWEASPVAVNDMANHICCLIDVKGVMTLPACEAALQSVVDRQEVLRLSVIPGRDRPVQLIRKSVDSALHYRELAASRQSDEAVEELAAEIFAQPFDMLQGPLYRAALFRRAPDDNILVFAIHHAIADGWSLGVLVQDICLGYVQGQLGLKQDLPPVETSYSAWGAAERSYWQASEIEKRIGFWKEHLQNPERIWPNLEGAATAAGSHRRWVTLLPPEIVDAAQQLARTGSATLYSTLLAVFQIALARWTGQTDTLVGTPVANRTVPAVRETMGYFSAVVPLRFHLDPTRPFAENLRSVHHVTVENFANAVPFVELAAALGDPASPGHNPIYEVRFALQNHPVPDVSLHGLSARLKMRSTGTARFLLGCEVTVAPGGLEVVWLHRPDLFPVVEIEELARIFTSTLQSACRDPHARISTLAE